MMVTFDICAGNPGALQFLMQAYDMDMFKAEQGFQRMQRAGITGARLYMLWNDCCNRDTEAALLAMNTLNIESVVEFINCNRLLKKEPKEKGQAPAMIVFCAFEQMQTVIEYGKRYGFAKSYPLFFCKNYSAQVLKANMKIVGATEFAVVLYRDKLPKFRNVGEDGGKHMVFDWFRWERDSRKEYPKIHPTQKPVGVLKRLIEVFTDPGDVVIDPVAGSGTTLRAAYELGRSAYGFEVDKSFYEAAREKMLAPILAEKTTI